MALESNLVIAFRDTLVVAHPRREGWTAAERLDGMRPTCLAADPLRPGRIYCGTSDHGLWMSDDFGESWRDVGAEIAERRITAVAVAPGEATNNPSPQPEQAGRGVVDPAVVYIGTEPSAVYRSEDGGEQCERMRGLETLPSASTWSFPPRPETHHVRWIEPDPHQPGRLFACIEAGALVRSDDSGHTWADRVPGGPYDTHTLATHPTAAGRLYSAAGDGYFESDDAGAHWRQLETGLRHHYLFGVAVDPADPDTVLVSAAPGPYAAYNAMKAESMVYRRSRDGDWRPVDAGLPEGAGTTVAVLVSSGPGEFWAANNRGVYRSSDAGRTWEHMLIDWPSAYTRRDVVAFLVSPT